ncbi:MAG: PAS domain S-box protein [Methanomicrobiaceae archaeon]|nr:PAS domain S-box protein [Methanomicrobiaceae archaeon]
MISDFSDVAEDSIYDIYGGANFILDENHIVITANAGFFDITGFGYEIIENDFNFLSLIPDDEVLLFINFFKKRLYDLYNSPKTSEFRVMDREKKEHRIILTAARVPETRRVFFSSLEPRRKLSQFIPPETCDGGIQIPDDNPSSVGNAERQVDQYFHFSYLVEHQPETVFVLIGDVIAYINEAGVHFFGKDNRYDIIGKSPAEFVEDDSKEKILKILQKMKTDTIRHPLEDNITINDGDVTDIEISLVPVIYEGIAGFQYSIRDITSSKKAQEQAALRLNQIGIVNSVLRSASSSFSLPEILENILKITIENFEFQSGWIYLKNTDSSTARLASFSNVPIWFRERYNLVNTREWPYNIIFYAGQPRYIENLVDQPPGIFDIKVMEDLGAISYAGIPIFSENAVVGVLYVAKGDNSRFTTFEKTTLEEIGKETGSIVVKGIVEERFEKEYNEIKDFLGIALKENERIWNTIISQRWTRKDSDTDDLVGRMELIREISPRMDIINNLRVIYEILLAGNPSLKPICLDSVIRSAGYHFADAEIEYDRALYFVFADDNLSYVFINILNIFCANQENVHLKIRHMNEKENITIIIDDLNDSKVIDSIEKVMKIPDGDTLRPANIPLYVTKMLIAAYNGDIDVRNMDNDQVEKRSLVIRLKRFGGG